MGDDNEFPGLSALGLYASDIRGDGMIDRLQPHFRSIVTADPPFTFTCLLACFNTC